MKTDPIQEFIIQNEESLSIAEAVSEALPKARHQMALGFLARLEVQIKKHHPGWVFRKEGTFFIPEQYAAYEFLKPNWVEHYQLKLQFCDGGKKMVFGVIGPCDDSLHDDLLPKIKLEFPMAKQFKKDGWEAIINMDYPAPDWRRSDILWRMFTEEIFLNEVANELLKLAKISEPIIDQLVLARVTT